MRYVFIINPNAGGKNGFKTISNTIKTYFQKFDAEYAVYKTAYRGHATEIVKDELQKGGKVRFYGVGGDGTLLEVARGCIGEADAEVGIFPVGSGNDYIRTYGTAEQFLNFDNQIKGTSISVDVIRTKNGDALNICSMGLDANVAYQMAKFKLIPGVGGSLAYDLALAKSLCGHLGENMQVKMKTTEGEKVFSGTYLFALAAVGRCYGGGYMGAPKAVTNDGLLDFILVKKPSLARIASLVNVYKTGHHLDDDRFSDILTFCRGYEMEVTSSSPICCNRDGECDKVFSESFSIIPGAVNFILPLGIEYGNVINTERLVIRNWKERDLFDITEMLTDPEVMLPSGVIPAKDEEEAESKLKEQMLDSNDYAIVLRNTGKVIGMIKYQRDHKRRKVNSCSMAYELNKDYWGKGYMTEALKAMVEHCFETTDTELIAVGHFESNMGSRKVIEKCGFKLEGVIRHAFRRDDGAVFDDWSYSMTRDDYLSLKNPSESESTK